MCVRRVYSKIHFALSLWYWTVPSGNQLSRKRVRRVVESTLDENLQLDLLLGVLNGVRAVADVATNSEGEVTTDGAYLSSRTISQIYTHRLERA